LVVARKGWGVGGRKNYASKKFGFPSPKFYKNKFFFF